MYFAGEKLLDLISFCMCPATPFASALNMFHLEPSCQVVLYIFPYFLYIVLTPVREYLMKMNFFFSSSLYNKPYCSYHCTALMFGIAAAHGWAGND